MQPYPIMSEQHLGVPVRRFMRRVRQETEIPYISSNQVLVFRVGAQHVLDNIRLPMDHDTVVNANHVAVINTGSDVPVDVTVNIPSAEAADFIARVTFVCRVTDPITVVVAGISDAATALVSYLKAHRPLFELGLDHPLDNVNEVRRLVSTTVEAMVVYEQPDIPGLDVRLIGVELMTPQDVAEFHGARRSVVFDNEIARTRQIGKHERESNDTTHAQTLEEKVRTGQKRYFADLNDLIGESPERARLFGIALGEETTSSYARSLEESEADKRRHRENVIAAQIEILRNLETIGLFQNLTLDETALLQDVLARAGINARSLTSATSDTSGGAAVRDGGDTARGDARPRLNRSLLVEGSVDDDD